MMPRDITLANLRDAGSPVRLGVSLLTTQKLTASYCHEQVAGGASVARRIGSFSDAWRTRPDSDGLLDLASLAGRKRNQLSPSTRTSQRYVNHSSVTHAEFIIGPFLD